MKKALYIANENTNYLKLEEAVRYFNVCATSIKHIAAECNAKVKIGESARYKKDVIEAYIESQNR